MIAEIKIGQPRDSLQAVEPWHTGECLGSPNESLWITGPRDGPVIERWAKVVDVEDQFENVAMPRHVAIGCGAKPMGVLLIRQGRKHIARLGIIDQPDRPRLAMQHCVGEISKGLLKCV